MGKIVIVKDYDEYLKMKENHNFLEFDYYSKDFEGEKSFAGGGNYNCTKCEDCSECYNCGLCTNCGYCNNCNSCKDCYNCNNCNSCKDCTLCDDSDNCTDCNCCDKLKKCQGFYYQNNLVNETYNEKDNK